MNFPFYIARRYLFSKKSTNVINIISGISMVGVAVASMAMIVTLSVFNGFSDLVASLFTKFDPQLEIAPVEGKSAPADDPVLADIKRLPEIEVATECVEDQALAVYRDRQVMVMVKGVQENFDSLTRIREVLLGDGRFELRAGPSSRMYYGILGVRLAEQLGTNIRFEDTLSIYAPRREGQIDVNDAENGFVREDDGSVPRLYSPGVLFAVGQAKYDKDYILTHIDFARSVFHKQGEISTLELRLKPGSDFERVKSRIAGKYPVIAANIVADVIIALAPTARTLLADNGAFIVSGIIDERVGDVVSSLQKNGFTVTEQHSAEGWNAFLCR